MILQFDFFKKRRKGPSEVNPMSRVSGELRSAHVLGACWNHRDRVSAHNETTTEPSKNNHSSEGGLDLSEKILLKGSSAKFKQANF